MFTESRKKAISKARCRNKSRGSTSNGGSVKGWARRWAHADFGEGRGSHGEFWREVRGNTQQNLLRHGCFRKEKHKWPRTPVLESF